MHWAILSCFGQWKAKLVSVLCPTDRSLQGLCVGVRFTDLRISRGAEAKASLLS
jgi:hypothetical protein